MGKFTTSIFTLALGLAGINAQAQRIAVTIVGTGKAAYNGELKAGKSTMLYGPKDVIRDASGNIYFTEVYGARVRKLSASRGIVTTIAGGGYSYADGIPATDASIAPNYMCMNSSGDIFITTSNMIRKISAAGIITTVAGIPTPGFGGDGGPAGAALLKNPQGICIDAADNLYFVDRGNQRIRKIDGTTGIITTIAGDGTSIMSGDGGPAGLATLKGPACITVNPAGDLFFSDNNPNYPGYDNSVIRKIDAVTGTVTRLAGDTAMSGLVADVPALKCVLGTTTGLSIAPGGELFCNEMSCSCRDMDALSDTMHLVGGNFYVQSFSDDVPGPLANMNVPYGLFVDNGGTVFIADCGNNRIRKYIKLTNSPAYAFGNVQFTEFIPSHTTSLDSMLWITDLDSAQTETWTVVKPPVHGTLSGFPTYALSNGVHTTVKPKGLTYTAGAVYAGLDSFQVQISDGVNTDVVTIYADSVPYYAMPVDPLSVTQLTTISGIKVYPNPARSVLSVEWATSQEKLDVEVTDISGRVVYTGTLAPSATEHRALINVATWPTGVYLLRSGANDVAEFIKQ